MALSVRRRADADAGAVRDDPASRATSGQTARAVRPVQPRLRARRATATRAPSAASSARKLVAMLGLRRDRRGARRCCSARMPTGFLPDEDQGQLTRPGACCRRARTQEQTRAVMEQVSDVPARRRRRTRSSRRSSISGLRFGGRGQNSGLAFVKLQHWDERDGRRAQGRRGRERAMTARSRRSRRRRSSRSRRRRSPSSATSTGFELQLEDRAGARPRRADRGAQPAARAGGEEPGAREGAPGRPRGSARVQDRRRPGEGGGARALARRHQRDAVVDVGRLVRQRLHRRRPHEARVHAGRRAVPHAAGGPRSLVRAQPERRDGAVLGVRDRAAGPSARRSSIASTASRPIAIQGEPAPGRQLRRRDGRDGGDRGSSCRRASATSGRGCRTRSSSRAPTR